MPYAPGQSGNPGGKPKTKIFRDALTLAINRADGDKTKLAKIAEALVEKAISGDVQAFNAIADRIDGKPPQPVGGSDELPPILAKLVREIADPQNTQDSDGPSIQTAT